jgi:hypothetical protein
VKKKIKKQKLEMIPKKNTRKTKFTGVSISYKGVLK